MLTLTVIPKMYHIHLLKNIEVKDKLSLIPHNNVLRYRVSKIKLKCDSKWNIRT